MKQTLNKKALDHVTNQLKGIDSYSAYSAIVDILQKAGIENEQRTKIMRDISSQLNMLLKPVRECAEWTKAISDSLES